MTDIEKKALALLNECGGAHTYIKRDWNPRYEALCRAIEQHQAFRQEVSDAVAEHLCTTASSIQIADVTRENLARFIIAKPDPLVEALNEAGDTNPLSDDAFASAVRAAIEKRGGKIVWREGH